MMMNPRKVAVIGCGFVGASIAFAFMQKGLFSEMVLIDANHAKAEGEAMDLSHGLPYTASMYIIEPPVITTVGIVLCNSDRRETTSSSKLLAL